MLEQLKKAKEEYSELLNQLSDPGLISNWDKFEALTKRKTFLEKIIDKEKEIEELNNRIQENKDILKSKEDFELSSLAETEIAQLTERRRSLEEEIKKLLSSGEEKEEPKAIIVEIRAGAGGDEATLFAANLFRMYSKYAQDQGWKQKTLSSHPTEIGGFKEIIFELKNGDVFSKMQFEGGVHRVQRIPDTEKNGRVHTSTASVAILPKPKKTQLRIRPEDLKIDTFRASGPGGQNVNKRETAIRITHLTTGIVVASQTERNQLQNKENALAILEVKILEKKEIQEAEKLGAKRSDQIKLAKRSEKIRTYNFPQDRITDHRVKKNFHNLEEVMNGRLDPIVKSLQAS